MRLTFHHRRNRGFITLLMVISTGVLLTFMMIFAYRSAMKSHAVQADVQLYVDYGEKEDAILRSIVSNVPNQAINTMRYAPVSSGAADERTWESIFTKAVEDANILRTDGTTGNIGDIRLSSDEDAEPFSIGSPGEMFGSIHGSGDSKEWVSPAVSFDSSVDPWKTPRNGYPPLLVWNSAEAINSATMELDYDYPIIANDKMYQLAGEESRFQVLNYPDINFGYFFTENGSTQRKFVAKRNWWAFEMDLGAHDRATTRVARFGRKFVLSIYEVPSQLALSASAFMNLQGDAWDAATIDGTVFAGRANGGAGVDQLALRRGEESTDVAVSSESGRVAFVPINRGALFFDRFASSNPVGGTDTVSPTTWDEYTMGSVQCAMQLDVVAVDGDSKPTSIRMSWLNATGDRVDREYAAAEWNDGALPFEVDTVISAQTAVVLKPDMLAAWLASVGGADTSVNDSIAVNVDYRSAYLGASYKPNWDADAGTIDAGNVAMVLRNCSDLTSFPKGFSLVSNLRLYIDDDFNQEKISDASSALVGKYPPCSIFAPEKRYGANETPKSVEFAGQIGSLKDENKQGDDDAIDPLQTQSGSGEDLDVSMDLAPIRTVEELPPIMMMNWLVVLEEVK